MLAPHRGGGDFTLISSGDSVAPGGAEGHDWVRYEIAQGNNVIVGYRRGDLAAVRNQLEQMILDLNKRRLPNRGRVDLVPSSDKSANVSVVAPARGEIELSRKIYVGNLPYSATEIAIGARFGEYGEVTSIKLIADRGTGRSQGYGFVEMGTPAEAKRAIEGLDGSDYDGWQLTVKTATPNRPERYPSRRGKARR
jgi:RNA recognition motif-containing protein